MSATTGIQWTDATFNPWTGCTKVSPGCEHCYAEHDTPARVFKILWGAGQPRRLNVDWKLPERLQRKAQRTGTRPRLFCASNADVFDNEVPDEWRARLFELIERTPLVTWQLLTKRIGNVRRAMPANVWLGATCVTQEEIERDLPKLRRSAAKAIAQVDGVPVAAVPTTLAGSPLTRSGRPLHLAAHGERVPPRLAIIDPDLLATAPPALLAATTLNSLAHAAESLYHPRATPLTHAVGMRGAGLLAGGSERSDLDDLALGGALAAWSLDLTGLLVHHAVCQSIVRTAGTPHALTNATMLPRTLALVEQRAPGALRLLATALGAPDAIGALERIRRLGARAGASGLAALGVTLAHVDAIADAAAGRSELAAMPGGAPSVAELRALVGGALDG